MPEEAYARRDAHIDDALDIYDQVSGSGASTAHEFLVSDGLTQEEATTAYDTIRTAAIGARVSFMAVRDGKLTLTYGVWIGQDGGEIWLLTPAQDQPGTLILETAWKAPSALSFK